MLSDDDILGLNQKPNSLSKYAAKQTQMAQDAEDDALLAMPNALEQAPQAEPQGLWAKAMKDAETVAPVQKNIIDGAVGAAQGVGLALESTANFAIDVADAFENLLAEKGIGKGDIIDETSQINALEKMFGEPQSGAEYAGKMLGQYLAPFGVVSKLSKAKGLIGAAQNIGLSSTISALITDPDDQRLSNLVQAYPGLANPIAEFLAHNEDDPRLLSRVKTGIEAAMVDTATLGLFKAGETVFKAVRTGKELSKARQLEKLSKADPVPSKGVIDEASLQAGEAKINAEFDEQAKQAGKEMEGAASTGEGAKPSSQPAVSEIDAQIKDLEGQIKEIRTPEYMERFLKSSEFDGSFEARRTRARWEEESGKIRDLEKQIRDLEKVKESAASGPTGKELKKQARPTLPKDPPLTEADVIKLRKAEDMAKPAPKTMKELTTELKASGRTFTAADLHNVAKRGVVSDKESMKIAEKIMKQEGKIDELLDRQFGVALNQEERNALKLEYMEAQMRLETTLKGIKNIDELSEAELAVVQEQIDHMLMVDASAAAASSEAGRALRTSQKIPGLTEGADDVIKMKKMKEYLKMYGGTQGVKDTLKQLKQIQDSNISSIELMEFAKKRIGTSVSDAAFELWVNSVLSGVKTLFVTNPLSNVVMAAGQTAEIALAEMFGSALMKKGVVKGETMAFIYSYFDTIEEAWASAKHMFKTGSELPTQRSKFLLSRKNAISAENFDLSGQAGKFVDTLGHVANTPTRVLSAQDVFFNMNSSRARVGQLAHRQAIAKGLEPGTAQYAAEVARLKANPPQSLIQEAERFGREGTLTSPLGAEQGVGANVFGLDMQINGDTIQSLQQTMEKFPLGRYAGAFMRVGTNLTDRAIQRTPLSFLRPETRRNLFRGSSASAQEEIAKITFGTGVMAAGGMLAFGGMITGGGPDEPKTIKALKSSGWQSYSIKTPNGWIQTKELGPLGKVLDISADIADLVGRIDADDENSYLSDELIYAGAQVIMNSFTPDYLKDGVPDFFQFIKDVADGKKSQDDVAQAIGKFSAGFVPMSGLLRSVKGAWRPEMGDTRVGEAEGMIEKTWAAVRGEWLKTAGLDGFAGLPPELNIFGEEVYAPMSLGGAIKSAVFGNDRDPNDPVVAEILRLDMTGSVIHVGGDADQESFALRMPERLKRRGIGVGSGVTVPSKLSPQEYHDYVKLSAGLKVGDMSIGAPPLKDALRELIGTKDYQASSDDMKKLAVKQIVSQYKKNAWQLMMLQPNIDEDFNTRRQNRLKNLFGRGAE